MLYYILTGLICFIVGGVAGALIMYNNKKALNKELDKIKKDYYDYYNDFKEQKKELRDKKDKLEQKVREITVKARDSKKSYHQIVNEILDIIKK